MPTNISATASSPAAASGYAGAIVEIIEWLLYKGGIADIPSEVTIAYMIILTPILHVAAKMICKKLDCNGLGDEPPAAIPVPISPAPHAGAPI